jgi:hypothetical protein
VYPGIRYPSSQVESLVYASDDGVVRSVVYVRLLYRYFPCCCPMRGGSKVFCALLASPRVVVANAVMAQRLHSTGTQGIQSVEDPHQTVATYFTTAFTITSKHMLSFFPSANDSIVLIIHTLISVFLNRKPRVDRAHSRPRGTNGVMMC